MSLTVVIAGSNGIIGSALKSYFQRAGHTVLPLVRPASSGPARPDDPAVIRWDPENQSVDAHLLEGADAVINLCGTNIAGRRWSPDFKKQIYDSRVRTTRFLSRTLCGLDRPPKVLLSASAVGFYGSQTQRAMKDEYDSRGEGFLSGVCADWEQSARESEPAGIRVVTLRLGAVLSPAGGTLARLLPLFRAGLGGPFGTGEQPFNWVALDEIPLIAEHLIRSQRVRGAVNVVSPHRVTNAAFVRTLGSVLGRPAVLRAPAWALSAALGEMAGELLMGGVQVTPRVLLDTGYPYRYKDLETALRSMI